MKYKAIIYWSEEDEEFIAEVAGGMVRLCAMLREGPLSMFVDDNRSHRWE